MRKLILLLLVSMVWATWPVFAGAKTYFVPDIQVRVEAAPDGAVVVEEKITYQFDGKFTFAYRDIPLKSGESVSNVSVSDGDRSFGEASGKREGTFALSKSKDNVRVTWYFRAKDESRTFELSYQLAGVIRRYSDAAVMYFQFVGGGWDRPIDNVTVRVQGPPGTSASNVRAWAHGPLHGTVDIGAGGVVRLNVSPLPARTYWEGRIVYPEDLFGGLPRQELAVMERIEKEERQWADEANRLRAAYQRQLEQRAANRARQRAIADRFGPAAWLLGLAGLALWFVLFRRYGRPHPVTSRAVPGEIPSDHPPAVVSYLVFSKNVGASAIVATLLDLAQRGHIEIEEVTREKKGWFGRTRRETDYRFFTGERPISELEAFERDLLDFLLNRAGTGTEFTMSGVKKTASKNRTEFRKWFRAWVKQVKEHGAAFGFYEPVAVGPIVVNVLAGLVILGGGIALSAVTETAAGAPAIVMGALQVLLSMALTRHTVEGRRLALAWRAFRTHLKNTSRARGPVSLSAGDWSRYLAAAVLFGLHKKLLPQIELAHESGRAAWPVWYHATVGASPGDVTGLADGFSSMVGIMSSTMSSASGTGGGASAGGGGGSGGGGGGAG